jgi:hypothetical protein
MKCRQCASTNQGQLPCEISVHFPKLKDAKKFPVLIFPSLRVCLDCGMTEFIFPEAELHQFVLINSAAM